MGFSRGTIGYRTQWICWWEYKHSLLLLLYLFLRMVLNSSQISSLAVSYSSLPLLCISHMILFGLLISFIYLYSFIINLFLFSPSIIISFLHLFSHIRGRQLESKSRGRGFLWPENRYQGNDYCTHYWLICHSKYQCLKVHYSRV